MPDTPTPAADEAAHWRDVVTDVGADIAAPLTTALETLNGLIGQAGGAQADELAQVRAAIETARQVGMTAQQLARYASRRFRLSHERLPLTALLRGVLAHRGREAMARGLPIGVAPAMQAAEVLADPPLLQNLLDTTVDWALRHAGSDIRFAVDIRTWPAHARIRCDFRLPEPDDAREAAAPPPSTLDSLTWRLLDQVAQTMDLIVERRIDGLQVSLTLEFPRTANESMEGASSIDLSDDAGAAPNSLPLVGSHVLVVASRREMRSRIREALQHMGLLLDLVSSVDEAERFCRDGLPHALIVEGILAGERLARLQSALWAEVPGLAFVEIVEEGDGYCMSDAHAGQHVAWVGRAAIESSLPSVLLFELSKGL